MTGGAPTMPDQQGYPDREMAPPMTHHLLMQLSDKPIGEPPLAAFRAMFQMQADALSGHEERDFSTMLF
jgi:hypothetical protein